MAKKSDKVFPAQLCMLPAVNDVVGVMYATREDAVADMPPDGTFRVATYRLESIVTIKRAVVSDVVDEQHVRKGQQ